VQRFFIGERFQEFDEVALIGIGQVQAPQDMRLVGMIELSPAA
jgi:hypothetical protein